MSIKPVTFLVIEDDDVDFWAAERAFSSIGLTNPVVRAHDGEEGLDKLRGTNGHAALTGPLIIFLDLNMPRMGGLEFLDRINADEALRRHKVIVVTTSTLQHDITQSYRHKVAGYVVKYDLIDGLREAFEDLGLKKALMAA